MAGNCKLATKLQTKKSMWEIWKVPQLLGSLDSVSELRSVDSDSESDQESRVWSLIQILESESESGV